MPVQTARKLNEDVIGISPTLDVEKIRGDFPILRESVHGKKLVYLDNAATTQKPQVVIDALTKYYSSQNANIHRGVHALSEIATKLYEGSRTKIRRFLNAAHDREIIFTRGTTESINLVAQSFGRKFIGTDDEIIVSHMEHHSNIVPWQLLCEHTGAKLRVIPIDDRGELIFEEFERLLNARTKLVSIVHISNALGTVNPIERIIARAHTHNVPVLVDGAQAVAHRKVDVRELDCDFYAFSGHKIFGPTGIGVLYGKEKLLKSMPPFQGGGDMIRVVSFEKTSYADLPNKFEAGTPNIAGVIGLGAAIDYVQKLGLQKIASYERDLLAYATEALSRLEGFRIIGTASEKAGVLSFVHESIHPHDIGTILDREGIAIRTGHHCAQPVMQRFGVPATSRASFAFYNTFEEVDACIAALETVTEIFS